MTLILSASSARAETINPSDARGIRYDGVFGPDLLSFLAIKAGTEDRTVLEFDVSGLSGELEQVTLDFGMRNIDPFGDNGIVDIFTYIGDGVVTPNEFFAGGPEAYLSFIGYGHINMYSLDVTSAVQEFVDAGDPFIGFRMSTETSDRYDLGSTVNLPDPVLTVIPEPATLSLLALSAAMLLRRRIGPSP